ncbi:phospholipase D family protein [Mesorhizobium sp. AA22]|uniref:phospholipase D-like domain-containing protein n=1 Tax=Mesorhizobium sp. AA22 TaxID=1854057 RepID=UPI0007EDBA86|nr:phospholipase D family protein [Mesorhizobium sp. AA22]QIA22859.1 hypothetical protein A9K68_014595 [Mesorhizobium sp. AA22]
MSGATSAAELKRLKEKWFINPKRPESVFPPVVRYPGSTIGAFSDGNRVTMLVDGAAHMQRWADSIVALKGSSPQLWHAGLALDDVGVRGKNQPGWNALSKLYEAHERGVQILGLLSDHGYYGNEENKATIEWLRNHGVYDIRRDPRYPNLAAGGLCCGSNHQKFTCVRDRSGPHVLLGSADIHSGRWDTQEHRSPNPDRYGKPTHEVSVRIDGPAVADLEQTFIERWNDPTRSRLSPKTPLPPTIPAGAVSKPAAAGTHCIQVLRTYGLTKNGYSWSGDGEFTVWASHINAISKAALYIYIEDQYFMPFRFPPCFQDQPGPARNSDIVYQLGEAIVRGVKVIVIVPAQTEETGVLPRFQKYQRDIGVAYLKNVAMRAQKQDGFTIATLHNRTEGIYVHAKLLVADDEFVSLGSANVNQKSMTHDSELNVGVVDADGAFVKELRKGIWSEHLAVDPSVIDDPLAGCALMRKAAGRSQPTGRVRSYDLDLSQPFGHAKAIARIDPYAGPVRN